jgi:hypothetical protein
MTHDPRDVKLTDIQATWPAISDASSAFMKEFGPSFTGTERGHIATDIAGSSAIAGRVVLEESGTDLAGGEPGHVLLWESQDREQAIIRFMRASGTLIGLDREFTLATSIPPEHEALLETNEMTNRLRGPLLAACEEYGLDPRFRPFVAAWAAMRLLAAASQLGLMPEPVGRMIAVQGIMRGARTVP